ncbi:type II secretion system protein GspL [Sphingomonas lenta]|uniref:type II secretion system protein GspL n=1 Tax=Sphingomonas lenta TaxID=1141887 RepID=UPI001FEA9D99|nr:type II secretion system protein GspL [Sphingomonas lenta]
MSPTYLFLPSGDRPFRWARVEGDALVEGEGVPAADEIVAVAPADAVTLHWAELPSRSVAQATAAARLLAAEASAAPATDLHVAVGEPEERDGTAPERSIGVVGLDAMRRWLQQLAEIGVDPVAIVPAPLLIPAPREGYARAELAGEGVVRGPAAGFADEARLTELLTGGASPATLGRGELAEALASVGTPLDLRQGAFARRRKFAIDWRLVRRLAWYAGAILLVTLAIDLVRLVKYDVGADMLQARADVVARQGLPRGATVTDSSRQLDERLAGLRGPGQGFSAITAAVFAAVQSIPGSELTSLSFEPNGNLRLGVTTATEAAVNDLKRSIERAGFAVNAGTFTAAAGRVSGEFVVVPR